MVPDPERAGVMVIRIWTETGADPLRARLTSTLDVAAPRERAQAAASREEILAAVRAFLDAFQHAPP
jgi:hypothetical protein